MRNREEIEAELHHRTIEAELGDLHQRNFGAIKVALEILVEVALDGRDSLRPPADKDFYQEDAPIFMEQKSMDAGGDCK